MRSRVLSHVSCISRSVHPEWPRPQLGGLQCFVGDDGLQIVDLQEYERYLPTHLRANDFQSTRQLGQSTSQTRQILVGMQSSRTLQSTPITTTPIHDHHNHSNPRPSRSLQSTTITIAPIHDHHDHSTWQRPLVRIHMNTNSSHFWMADLVSPLLSTKAQTGSQRHRNAVIPQ